MISKSFATPSLLFRLTEPADQAWFIHLYMDPEIMRWIPGGAMMEDRALAMSERAVSGALKNGLGYYIIHVDGGHDPAGYIVLRPFSWDERFSGVELGYIIDKSYWGKRIASRSAAAAVEFAKTNLKVDRLLVFVGNENTASIKVVQKLGFTKHSENSADYPGNSTWELKF
jgi:RimJ/RimL family protein N-acetyltransferase